jgi:hypothetical protein
MFRVAGGALEGAKQFLEKGFKELKCKAEDECVGVFNTLLKRVGQNSLSLQLPLIKYEVQDNNGNNTTDEQLTLRILRLYELCNLEKRYQKTFFNNPITDEFITVVKDSISNLLSLIISIEISQELTDANLRKLVENIHKLSDAEISFKTKFGKPSVPVARQKGTMFGLLKRDTGVEEDISHIYKFLQDIYNPIQYRVSIKARELETIISRIKEDMKEREGEDRLRQKLGLLEAAGYGPDRRTFKEKLDALIKKNNEPSPGNDPSGGGGGGSSGMGGRRKQKIGRAQV